MREQLVAGRGRRLRAKKWATLAVASAVASVFADATIASAATVTFGTGQVFSATKLLSPGEPTNTDDAFLINPDGGYAVAVDSGAVTTATGVAFEGGGGATTHAMTTLVSGHATLSNVGTSTFLGLAAISTASATSTPSSQDFSDGGLYTAVANANEGGGNDAMDLTLNNLTVGHSYVVELIMANARTSGGPVGTFAIASNSTDFAPGDSSGRVTIAFDPAVASNNKVAGGYLDASFTADSTSQNIFLQAYLGTSGNLTASGGFLNAFVVRDQTVATTPNNLVWDNTRSSTGDGATWSPTAGGINQNWSIGGALASSYNPGDNVVFNDFNHGDYTVNIASSVSPGSLAVTDNFGNYVFNGPGGIAGSTSLTKSGVGTLTLNSSNTYTGSTNVNGGILEINASKAGALAATTALNFGGGTLMLLGNATSGATQTLGNVTISGGGGTITVDNNSGSGTTTLNLGTLASASFSNGSSLNITTAHLGSGSAAITTTTGNDATGIIGTGRVIYNGTDWAATASVSAPFVLSAYTGYNSSLPIDGSSSASTNYVINTAPAAFTASSTVNTLKIADNTTNGNINLGGNALTLATGGLLYTGSGGYNISNGMLTSGMASTPDLIVNQYGTGALTISSVIANGTAGLTTLTKTGPGTLILSNASTNTYTGDTYVNGGILSTNADSEACARNTSNVVLNGGEFQYTGTGLTTLRNFILGGSGGIFDIKNGVTYIIGNGSTGTVSGTGGLTLTSTGGRLILETAGNSFSGGVTINGGIFEITLSGALNNANDPISFGPSSSGKLTLSSVGQDMTITGLNTTSANASIDDVNSANTLVVNNSTDSFYNGKLLSDAGRVFSLAKMGPAKLTLNNSGSTYAGVTNISGGVLSISNFGPSGFSPTILSANSSSTTLVVSSTTGLVAGMAFVSANFTSGTTVTAVNASAGTITVNSVASTNTSNGVCNIGSPAALGISTNAASNLILNGGTLQYTGPSVSADRNYTLGIYGGGLDVSGATAGPLTMTGSMTANGTTGAQTFTLTGSSTTTNTIAGTISDGTGTNQTALAKTGTGTWVLGNTGNSYSGGTTIIAGTLQIASDSSLGAATGGVGQFSLTAKGSGYTSQPTVNFGGSGSGASVNALMGVTTVAASGGDFVAQIPTITISGSSGTNATATAQVGVFAVDITGAGTGYTSAPTITFAPSPTGDTTTGTVQVSGGSISTVTITHEGSGYNQLPAITLAGGSGSGATFSIETTLTGLAIVSPGSGYTNLASVSIPDPISDTDSGPSFTASATALDVTGLSVSSPGTGYTTLPAVSLTGGGGTGATANASLVGYLTLAGGTLQTSAPFTSSRNIATTSATSAIDTQANNNTFSGVISGNGALNKLGSGTLTLTNNDIYTGNTNILGGTLAITGTASIASSAVINLNGGSLDVSGTSSTFTVGLAQTLRGQGTVLGPIIVNGTIATGQTTGVANKSAATLTLASGSSLLGSTLLDLVAGPGTSDQIVFANGSPGSITLGGTLFVTNSNGIAFAGGQSYDLFNYEGNTESGTFSNVPAGLPTLGAGMQWVTSSLYTTGVISIISSGPSSLVWNNAGGSGNGTTWDTVQQNWNNGSGVVAYSNTSNGTTGDNVTFNDSNNGKYGVTISGTVNPTSVTFNNSSGNYTVGGANAASGIAGSTSLIKFGSGSVTLSSSNAYTGGTSVNAGTLILASANAFPVNTSLTIATGAAQVTIANHSSNATYVPVASALVNTGTLDLTNNAMVVHNGSIGTITAQVQLGYNNGAWNGTSAGNGVITSSLAAADSTHLTAVGVATGLTSFEGGTVLASDVLMKYTYYGDTNLDGRVDGSDYSRIDSSFLSEQSGPAVTGWDNGDFNYDNVVNGSDYTLIDNAFNSQGVTLTAEIASPTAEIAGSSAGSTVPEPTTLGLLGIAAVGLLGRRGHRRIRKAR